MDLITEKISIMELWKAKTRYQKRLRSWGIFYRKPEPFSPYCLREFELVQEEVIPMHGFPTVEDAIKRWIDKVDTFITEDRKQKVE